MNSARDDRRTADAGSAATLQRAIAELREPVDEGLQGVEAMLNATTSAERRALSVVQPHRPSAAEQTAIALA